MKTNKKIFAGVTVLVLLTGLVLTGCSGTLPTYSPIYMETETSKEILMVAKELVASKEGGITVGELMTGLTQKFPGLTISSDIIDALTAPSFVEYQGVKYEIVYGVKSEGVVTIANNDSIVVSVYNVRTRKELVYTDTDISQEIKKAAEELVASQEGGIPIGDLLTGLGEKFSGLKLKSSISVSDEKVSTSYGLLVEYQGKEYVISFKWGKMGGITFNNKTIVTEIISAQQIQ